MSVQPSEFYTPKVLGAQLTGMIKTKGENEYSARLRIPVGLLTADALESLARLCRKHGRGEILLTARYGVELPGVTGEGFEALRQELADAGIGLAGCGPRMRTTTACRGTVCPHGNVDTFQLAWEIDQRYNDAEVLPHKFKVGVSGCASSCSKPQLNDVGLVGAARPECDPEACTGCGVCMEACHLAAVEMDQGLPCMARGACVSCGDCIKACPLAAMRAGRTGVHLFAGGRWGRVKQVGIQIAEFLTESEAIEAVGRIKAWYRDNGEPKERLGQTILRIGPERFQAEVLEGVDRDKWTAIAPEALERFQPFR